LAQAEIARGIAAFDGRRVALDFFARGAREEGPMNRDEIKGKAEKAKGYVKDKAGELLDDPELEAEGEAERVTGAVRETVGRAKRKAKDGIEEIATQAKDDIEE
jgi:uncharacterized protein YjbJ (UPF0337 family)